MTSSLSTLSTLPTLPAGSHDIDRALAEQIHRLTGGDDWLARTAALVSRERGLGHVCVDLRDHAGALVELQVGSNVGGKARWPDRVAWRDHLLASQVVSSGEDGRLTPLVLDGADRLYLSRYFRAERQLARAVAERSRDAREPPANELVAALFEALFPEGDERIADHARAARAALRGGLTLITGGPGTGKTTAVTRILVLLRATNPELRIALAAPTGKAAARLGESIGTGLELLRHEPGLGDVLPRIFPQVLPGVPSDAGTLHRLLGYQPGRDRFRYRAGNPLPFEVVVVDEASMVDLLMMNALIQALPPTASLVLLGDRDQLASVETGFVFGDLATAAGLVSQSHSVAQTGLVSPTEAVQNPWAGSAVELRHNWRFAERTGIGDLAAAVRVGDVETALAVLVDAGRSDVGWHPDVRDASWLEPLEASIDAYLAAADAETALERLAEFRILCATRVGLWGVERVNLRVERWLAERGVPVADRFYARRPILVQQNDYQSGLFNGDLGICWYDGDHTRAIFPGTGGAPLRRLPLAKLPRHDTAWAMTVHKSQGSEFDRVLLILPEDVDAAGGILSRELIYTGLTRARRRGDLVAPREVLVQALACSSRRRSGLVDALVAEAAGG